MDSRPRSLDYLDREPRIHGSAFVAQNAIVLGDAQIGEESSVWYGCVIRADINRIIIGDHTSLQDQTIIHVSDRFETVVGNWVTVGHRALLHACTIQDEVLVGMGAIVMDGAVVGSRSIIGAGAVVTRGTEIPPGSLALGAPAYVSRVLSEDEQADIKVMAQRYVFTSREYLKRDKN